VADVNQLTFGLLNPLFASGISALACLLGLILATQALGVSGRARLRLLVYASIALGGCGIWAAQLVGMLGFSVPVSMLRYAPPPLAASFGFAVLGTGAGLAVACTGRTRFARLFIGGMLIAGATAGSNEMLLQAIRVGGTVSVERNVVGASVAAAAVTAGILVSLLVSVRRLWVAIVASVLLGLVITVTHYVAMTGVQVRLGVAHTAIEGVSPILLFAGVILFSTTVLALLWFFAAGTATRHDLRAVFAATHRPAEIEPRVIEEVTARIALGTGYVVQEMTDTPPTRRPTGPRATPGATPWRTMPAWESVAMAVNGRTSAGSRTNTRASIPWVANPPVPVEPSVSPVSSVDDTDVHGLGAALINAAAISARLDAVGPGPSGFTTMDSPSPIAEPGADAAMGDVVVLTEASPDVEAAPESDPDDPQELPKRSRWRNRRR
jgi:NO-binding membrane sensor protein with MHYT domain